MAQMREMLQTDSHQLPDSLICYLDYEAFARDLIISDYYSVDVYNQVYVFSL